jgi:hypothetical protein
LTAEGATISGGNAIDGGRRWLERPLYDAPLPLVANNWPALDDPKRKKPSPPVSPKAAAVASRPGQVGGLC